MQNILQHGYSTGDNLQVNDVMLRELETQMVLVHIDDWVADEHRLKYVLDTLCCTVTDTNCSCMSHTVHLPTRAFIDAREDKKNRAPGVRAETAMVRNVAVLVSAFLAQSLGFS